MSHVNIKSGRNYGIDLLRILSMFMVVVLHTLGKGGILSAVPKLSVNSEILWFIEILCYCAVNCFLMISGYVAVNSRYKYSSIISLWLHVIFYTVVITGIFAIITPEKITADVIKYAFFPVLTRHYWYFTGYFALFLLMPILNTAMEHLTKGQFKAALVIIFVLFSTLTTVFNKDVFQLDQGYSLIWMMFPYIFGGYFKRFGIPEKLTSVKCFMLYLASAVLAFIGRFLAVRDVIIFKDISLIEYTSPLILLCSVFLFLAFCQIKTGDRVNKVIAFISPLSFGVYLIHTQKLIWNNLIANRFVSFAEFSTPRLILAVFATAICIFVLCLIIDYIRAQIFKLLKIQKLSAKIDEKISLKINKES